MKRALLGIFLFFFILGISGLFFIKIIKAQETTSTTFPVDEAGLAAYIRVKNIKPENLSNIPFETIEKQGKTFVYGKLKTEKPEKSPHLYIGLDGWIVAYYLRDEPRSKMINFGLDYYGNFVFLTNELEKAVCSAAGYFLEGCSEIKYYDFEFPQATRMSLVGEKVGYGYSPPNKEDFLVAGFQEMYDASYQLLYNYSLTLSAQLGENKVFERRFSTSTSEYVYDRFPKEIFSKGGSPGTKIILERVEEERERWSSGILGVVLIYKELE